MSAFNRFACVGLALLIPAVTAAQPVNLPQTRITAVFPPGAQQGTTVDVTVTGGSDLDEVSELLFSHPGLKAAQKLDGAGNPVGNTFTVSVDAAVRPGLYDLRVRGLFGISNPRIFRVDSLPEVAEDDANNTRDAAKPLVRNTIINARSNGGSDVDMYQIDAKAGETIVFRTEAARLDSLMQPLLQLFDQNGRRVGESRRVLNRDAAIVYRSQTDQNLLLKVHDIVFGGGNEFVYRLCADNRPLVDYVMPPLISTQRPTEVTLFGRHIPDGEPTGETLDGVPVFRKAATISADEYQSAAVGADSVATSLNTLLYSGIDGNLICLARYDGGPVPSPPLSADAAGTETSAALSVSLPAEVSGQFEALNDEDIVRFDAKKGQIWQMNVLSQRLGAPSNPVMVVEKINRAE
ncbi:MAG: hypothetical protein KDA89_19425, partial [Planctomycetaceae bacterium]|nr:hypothetical protein [Planctomycetaceae bacterium]